MKRYLALILIYSVLHSASTTTSAGQEAEPAANQVSHIATALNHLTVLEFQEPVMLAAKLPTHLRAWDARLFCSQ